MNIKLVQLINNEYIICEYDELDEEPSLHMKNPYRVIDITYWDYKEGDSHEPPENTILLGVSTEKNIKDGVETICTQTDYVQLERYPKYTNDVDILLNSDKIMTIIEPQPEILTLYTQLISK